MGVLYRLRRLLVNLALLLVCVALASGGIGLGIASVLPDEYVRPTRSTSAEPSDPPTPRPENVTRSADRSRSDSSERKNRSPSATPSQQRTRAVPLPVTDVRAYDPYGDGTEHDEAVGLLVDDDPTTSWITEHYSTADFGGLKSGVGVLVDLGRPRSIERVRLRMLAGGGSTFRIRAGSSPGSLAVLPVVATVADAPPTVTVEPSSEVTARYVLVWFTELPPRDGAYRGGISELNIYGEVTPDGPAE